MTEKQMWEVIRANDELTSKLLKAAAVFFFLLGAFMATCLTLAFT